MHGSKAMVSELLDSLLAGSTADGNADLAVFPPGPFLPMTESILIGSHIQWGGQTLNPNAQGAHTGETSGNMLMDMGCRYVLVGHSERRSIYGESDKDVAVRFKAALDAGLEPVLCVGETLQEREANDTEAVVARQLDAVIDSLGIDEFSKAVIAYEPVWAIGTGLTATPEQAQQVHAFLRDRLRTIESAVVAEKVRIQYGGSVKPDNAGVLLGQEHIEGALVGGASLDAASFAQIVKYDQADQG